MAGICAVFLIAAAVDASGARAEFGFRQTSLSFNEEDGTLATRAGSHPFALTASMMFNTVGSGESTDADGNLKDLRIVLPPGLIGTPSALPHCYHADFNKAWCPSRTAIGVVQILVRIEVNDALKPLLIQAPVYNLTPKPGIAAELGVLAVPPAGEAIPMSIQLGISSAAPNPLIASFADAPHNFPIVGFKLVLWGEPEDPAHDPYRGTCGSAYRTGGETFESLSAGSCPLTEAPQFPLLSLPPSCAAPSARFEATSWTQDRSTAVAEGPALAGCSEAPFEPELEAAFVNRNANSPSEFGLRLDLPDQGLLAAGGVASSLLSEVGIDLPAGLVINPPAADDLGVCTPGQASEELAAAEFGEGGCPAGSQIGGAELTTPLFGGKVAGRIFMGEPSSPFDRRFTIYLALKAPKRGLSLVQPILIEADPFDGTIHAAVVGVPQLPFERLELRFDSGPRAPFATPTSCAPGSFTYFLRPSSGNPPAPGAQSFATDGNCPTRFQPSLSSQLSSSVAGSPVGLALQIATTSREASPASIGLTLPPGLSLALGSRPLCPEAAAPTGDCPAGSRLGDVRIAVGAGPRPLMVPSDSEPGADLFLAGPFQGAPFSLVVKLLARTGPFNLGTAILRAPVTIDPETAQATIRIDALPRILAGVPLRYRELRVALDRPGLIHNPTSCGASSITGTATSVDGQQAPLVDPLQSTNCRALPFTPRLALSISGALGRNGHPALHALLRSKPGEANIATAGFTLPQGQLLDLRHLRGLCPQAVGPEGCPSGSRLGHVQLRTPLMSDSLEGPVFLARPTRRLPDLIADLKGEGVRVRLHGHLAAPGGRLGLEFEALPDVPVTEVRLTLDGGRRGLLVNSESLCGAPTRATAGLIAHNGRRSQLRPFLRVQHPAPPHCAS